VTAYYCRHHCAAAVVAAAAARATILVFAVAAPKQMPGLVPEQYVLQPVFSPWPEHLAVAAVANWPQPVYIHCGKNKIMVEMSDEFQVTFSSFNKESVNERSMHGISLHFLPLQSARSARNMTFHT